MKHRACVVMYYQQNDGLHPGGWTVFVRVKCPHGKDAAEYTGFTQYFYLNDKYAERYANRLSIALKIPIIKEMCGKPYGLKEAQCKKS